MEEEVNSRFGKRGGAPSVSTLLRMQSLTDDAIECLAQTTALVICYFRDEGIKSVSVPPFTNDGVGFKLDVNGKAIAWMRTKVYDGVGGCRIDTLGKGLSTPDPEVAAEFIVNLALKELGIEDAD